MGWRFANTIIAVLSGGFFLLKLIADWIGRSTVAEDASALRQKVDPMLDWIAQQPGYAFYGVSAGLFAVSAYSLFLRWHDIEQLAPIWGKLDHDETAPGYAFYLPIKIRSWRGAQSRVTMEVYTLGAKRVAGFVLLTEQALLRDVHRVGRITLDDTFKRFQLINYDIRDDRIGVVSEAGDYWITSGDYRLVVTVVGAGPARSKLFTLHKFDAGLRLSDGSKKGSLEILFEDELELLPASSGIAGNAAQTLIACLDDLKAEAVAERNRLIPPLKAFDYKAEEKKFCDWQARAMEALERYPHHRSRIRTLNRFDAPAWRFDDDRTGLQINIEAIWSEAIERLDDFIQKLGAKLSG